MNPTLLGMVRSMLNCETTSKGLLGDTAVTSAQGRKRLARRARPKKNRLHQIWLGNVPSTIHLIVFGITWFRDFRARFHGRIVRRPKISGYRELEDYVFGLWFRSGLCAASSKNDENKITPRQLRDSANGISTSWTVVGDFLGNSGINHKPF